MHNLNKFLSQNTTNSIEFQTQVQENAREIYRKSGDDRTGEIQKLIIEAHEHLKESQLKGNKIEKLSRKIRFGSSEDAGGASRAIDNYERLASVPVTNEDIVNYTIYEGVKALILIGTGKTFKEFADDLQNKAAEKGIEDDKETSNSDSSQPVTA